MWELEAEKGGVESRRTKEELIKQNHESKKFSFYLCLVLYISYTYISQFFYDPHLFDVLFLYFWHKNKSKNKNGYPLQKKKKLLCGKNSEN